jgi:hypothetical protein
MEAELVMAELGTRAGKGQPSASLLKALSIESGRKGFKGIQQRSESALRKLSGG